MAATLKATYGTENKPVAITKAPTRQELYKAFAALADVKAEAEKILVKLRVGK